MPDNTLSTLEQIRIKIRRLTKSPSLAQITDTEIDQYVNNFVLYDFPEHLRTFSLRTTLIFYTKPYIDRYSGDEIAEDFQQKYANIYENAYIGGVKTVFTQSREQFFNLYPNTEYEVEIATGDGATANYTGTLNSAPILRNSLYFTSIDQYTERLYMYDEPLTPNDNEGIFIGEVADAGSIIYLTGIYDITFDEPPADGEPVIGHYVPYVAGKPNAILYYANELTFRPVPDQAYKVELEVGIRPAELLDAASSPEMSQWWQYIAYGAAKKIFEDRMDMESVQMIMPEFKQQELLVNRRLIDQQSKERTATIYTDSFKGDRYGL